MYCNIYKETNCNTFAVETCQTLGGCLDDMNAYREHAFILSKQPPKAHPGLAEMYCILLL